MSHRVIRVIDVVGLGDAGVAELPEPTARLVHEARVLLGGARHLALVPQVDGQQRQPWPSPMRPGLAELLTRVGAYAAQPGDPTGVVVLASGDPLLSGVGTTLIALLGADAVRVHPFLSAATLARARMGWPAEETVVVSVVGRSPDRLRRHLDPGARLVVLCADGRTPAAVAGVLCQEGCGSSAVTAWWHLGGPDEGSRRAPAAGWGDLPTDDLVTLCVEVDRAGALSRKAIGPAPGRPDEAFEHDGQLTKRDARASALAHLRPTPGGHLWDLGAGAGSVGIEWALSASGARTSAVEQDPVRAARIETNAARLGVPREVTVHLGSSADVMDGLADPDAVFVGGGLTPGLLAAAWDRLLPRGRFVAHAVTLATEAVLVEGLHFVLGGELARITVEHARPLGRHLSWTSGPPGRPVERDQAERPAYRTPGGDAMTVHFIGAGPGAADLLTLRAVRLMAASPVCLYAGTYLDADVLRHCPPGRRAGRHPAPGPGRDRRASTCARTQRGKDVARLCSGDPSIYSAVAEQTRRLDAAGVPWDVTPAWRRMPRRRPWSGGS